MVTDWANFFLGQVGASAALGGLLFVAVSLNLSQILKFPALPGRALGALALLLAVLVVSSLMLVPGQTNQLIGVEMLAVGAIMIWLGLTIGLRARNHIEAGARRRRTINMTMFAAAVVPYALGGLVLLAGKRRRLFRRRGNPFVLRQGGARCLGAAGRDQPVTRPNP